MKRLVAACLAALTLCSLTGCGLSVGTKESSVSPAPGTSSAVSKVSQSTEPGKPAKDRSGSELNKYVNVSSLTERAQEKVVDVFDSGKFTLEAEGDVAIMRGLNLTFRIKLAKDGKKLYKSLFSAGQTVTSVTNDGGTYTLDADNKTAVKEQEEDSDSLKDTLSQKLISYVMKCFGLNDLTYRQDGQEEFEGQTLSFEEYSSGDMVIKLYYDGDSPKYLSAVNGSQKSLITVKQFSADADSTLFEIPSDYQIKES